MICHKIGISPTSTIGFGFIDVSSLNLVPRPPARITAFMVFLPEINSLRGYHEVLLKMRQNA